MQTMTLHDHSSLANPMPVGMRIMLGEWQRRASIRLRIRLQFGAPSLLLPAGVGRRLAVFQPAQCCARWVCLFNGYGLVQQELLIVQAPAAGQAMQRIAGITPGARILLTARTAGQVRQVLALLADMQRDGWRLQDVSPGYWRAVHNRLQAQQPLPVYSHHRHTAWTAWRGVWE